MSSNFNIVDKLNPTSFEKNEPIPIKIDTMSPKEIELIANQMKDAIKKHEDFKKKDVKTTISFSESEESLIELEQLYDKCLYNLEIIKKKAQEHRQISTDETNKNSLKKKLILNSLLNPLLNLF